MKMERIYLVLFVLFAVIVAGCSVEEIDPNGHGTNNEEQEVRLLIKSAYEQKAFARDEQQAPEGNEETIVGDKVWVYVYNSESRLEEKMEAEVLENNALVLMLTTGDKYIYILANPMANGPFGSKVTRAAFERQILDVAFTEGRTPGLTKESFVMGTLWASKVTIRKAEGGVVNNITAEIGRLSAKLRLWKVNGENKEYSNMKGKFVNPFYSVGSVPRKTFLIGQLQTPSGRTPVYPPATRHDVVESAVHNEPPVLADGITQNPVFYNYEGDFMEVKGGTDVMNHFYVVENTTAPDVKDLQYYGNTTYIRLRTQYIPDQSEICSRDLTQSGNEVLTDGTFWTCIYNNQLYITNERPEKDGATQLTEYVKGINYHFFPIMNTVNQSDERNIYCVLRNHYYEIEVTGIRDLGVSDKDKEDPWVPIPKKFEVDIAVNVIDWSKITQKTNI